MTSKKLVKDVNEFLNKCSGIVGNYEDERFHIDTWCFCSEGDVDSPIEHYFYAAIRTLIHLNGWNIEFLQTPNGFEPRGVEVEEQVKIDNYRVDFKITYCGKAEKQVLVECDSQQWHERTEEERRYEKQRDRHFTNKDLKFFHFTGREIMEKPFATAAEVLAYVTGRDVKDLIDVNFIDE